MAFRLYIAAILCLVPTFAFADHELDNRDVARGGELYAKHCASCHGANLQGQPNWQITNQDGTLPAPPHNQTGHTWHHDNEMLFDYTKLGGKGALALRGYSDYNSGMQGFADDLTDEEIWNVLAFIKSTWPDLERQIQSERNPKH